jgi:hypothetical protein
MRASGWQESFASLYYCCLSLPSSCDRRDAPRRRPGDRLDDDDPAASFALDYLARLWTPTAALRPISLFRYYQPQSRLGSGVSVASVTVLTAVTAVALLSALSTIAKRDLRLACVFLLRLQGGALSASESIEF